MVGASRMGNLMNPRWCFSDAPFDMTLAAHNELHANDSSSWFVVTMRIKTGEVEMVPYGNSFRYVACESL